MRIRKGVKLPVILASLVAAMLLPASALAENVCPPGFDLQTAPVASSGFWADRNGDGLQCNKVFGAGQSNILIINIDNNVPDRTALGVTEDGSTVLVNTDTGVVSP
jgi:hypothetical protein